MVADWRSRLDAEFEAGQSYKPNKADWLDGRWSGLRAAEVVHDDARRGETGVALDKLKEIGAKISVIPESFNVHKTIERFLENRRQMIETGEGIDWATAEALAFATLCDEGHPVRLSGQDCERGTFSQRHSVLIDQETEERYVPLNNVRDGQARYEVINSMLSEEAVLGFEYGFSLAEPNALTMWEAQFGDFANGAQVVFDQFVSSGERKWLRMSGLVCLLPHGYEGQGPEHSSARLERYLQMCAEDNMQVANCTTPAQYFHILRRQLKRDIRKPLILMTPKSLLRHKRAVSRLDEFASGHDLPSPAVGRRRPRARRASEARSRTTRSVASSCARARSITTSTRSARSAASTTSISLRVEQLYPFPLKALVAGLVALQEGRHRVVPGRAEEHGLVDLRRAVSGMGADAGGRQVEAPALRRPSRLRRDGDRAHVQAPRTTEGVPRRSIRRVSVTSQFHRHRGRLGAGMRT